MSLGRRTLVVLIPAHSLSRAVILARKIRIHLARTGITSGAQFDVNPGPHGRALVIARIEDPSDDDERHLKSVLLHELAAGHPGDDSLPEWS